MDNSSKTTRSQSPHSDEQRTVPIAARRAGNRPLPPPVPSAGRPPVHPLPAVPYAMRRPAPRPEPWLARGVMFGRWRVPFWALGGAGLLITVGVTLGLFLVLGMMALGSNQILPAVSVAGIRVGGLTEEDAARVLASHWAVMRLTDGSSGVSWQIPADRLGLLLDPAASAAQAYRVGRSDGQFFGGLFGVNVGPVGTFDGDAARAGLSEFVDDVAVPAQNAGIALENGVVRATPAREGRAMDLDGTLETLSRDPLGWLREGRLPLKMVTLYPTVTDSSRLVDMAQALLTQPLTLKLFDPLTGGVMQVSAAPEVWAGWLEARPDASGALGVRLHLRDDALRGFIEQADAQVGSYRYLKTDVVAEALQSAVRALRPEAQVRVYHEDRPRVVQAGETVISIAYQEGVPYPWVQRWNGGASALTVGQTLMIPSVDHFLKFEPVMNKRIIVSIAQQRLWAYENGALKWEWTVSTGVNDSPTWPGVYQVISHYPNAYAGNWNLYMPWFMGIYQPIPDADFTNGFHGYPTRGGGQILWRNSLGRKVTYGCIMLDDANARLLYDWAEEGVIVEIQP